MPKDYRFEILTILYENSPSAVNLRPLFMEYIENQGVGRQTLVQILRSLKKDELIWHDDLMSLSVSFAGKFDDTIPINARIEYKGIDEYLRLQKQYEPATSTHSIHVGGNFTGNISQGNSGSVTQSSNDENPESIALARKGYKLNKWILAWAIIAVLVTIAIYYLSTHSGGK